MPTRPSRLRALLELVRLPNVFTAPADVAMGLAVSGAVLGPQAAALLLASACAYAGGMALNDAFDARVDALERPERPIPSGRISRAAALAVAAACLAACLALAAAAGPRSFLVAALLVAAIAVYDGLAKGGPVGPASMAACRALNVGLGMSAGAVGWATLGPALALFAYVLVITVVSRFEVMAAPTAVVRGAVVAFGTLLATMAALVLACWGLPAAGSLLFLALLAAWLATPLRAAVADPTPRRIIGVIKAAVLGIVLVDATFAAAAAGLAAGLAVAALFVPAYVLGRKFASA
jgi:4-hydroxybenzoate polyprenyltransferase